MSIILIRLSRLTDENSTKDRVLVGTVLNVIGIAVAAIGLIIFLAVVT